MTRILAFSDMHMSRRCAAQIREAAPEADLVIGAGDFCNKREGLAEAMDLLAEVLPRAVLVPGNAESAEELRAAAGPAMVLHGEAAEVAGVTLFGIGYAVPRTPFGEWSCDLDEAEAEAMLAGLDAVDILISHSPPKGTADQSRTGEHFGSTAVRDAILRAQPKLCFCGHIHESWGAEGAIGKTQVRNLGPSVNWFEV